MRRKANPNSDSSRETTGRIVAPVNRNPSLIPLLFGRKQERVADTKHIDSNLEGLRYQYFYHLPIFNELDNVPLFEN